MKTDATTPPQTGQHISFSFQASAFKLQTSEGSGKRVGRIELQGADGGGHDALAVVEDLQVEPFENPADLQHAAASRGADDGGLGRHAEEGAALDEHPPLDGAAHPQPIARIARVELEAVARR